jgi:putative flippase GtrA
VKYAQFSAVGIFNMLVDVGVLNFLLLLGPTRSPELLVLYNVAALILANANSYLWNTLWIFKDQARHDAKQVGMFTAQGLFNVALGSALLWLAAHGLMAYTDLALAQRLRGQGYLHGVRLDGQLPLFAPVRVQAKEA